MTRERDRDGRFDRFHQRWLWTFSADGDTIQGRWETSPDGRNWELDFELAYHRLKSRDE
jgi:hypothetical protein